MKLVIKTNERTGCNEAFIGEKLVGVFEQMTPEKDTYSFMSKCAHDVLTGDHYILIGKRLNALNSPKISVSSVAPDSTLSEKQIKVVNRARKNNGWLSSNVSKKTINALVKKGTISLETMFGNQKEYRLTEQYNND